MKAAPIAWQHSGVRWLILSCVVFLLDIGIKYQVMQHMGYGWEARIEIGPFFNLLYVHNYGAAFSFLSEQAGWQRWLFSAIAFGVMGCLVYWMRKLSASKVIPNLAYALIIGGAAGNVFDRLWHGFVVDYLDFYWQSYHWPAFNLADAAICIGAVLIIIESFLEKSSSSST